MIKQILKSKKAFTMVEAIVVIVLVGISVLIWGFYGRGNVKSSMLTEGKMLIEKIVAQEKVYYADRSTFFTTGLTGSSELLYMNLKENKYFSRFSVSRAGNVLTIQLSINTATYPDMAGYSISGAYHTDTDIINYTEVHHG